MGSVQRTVLYLFILSYLAVLIIPIVINMVTYKTYEDVLREEVTVANKMMLEYVKTDVDSKLNNITQTVTRLLLNDKIKNMTDYANALSMENRYNIL